MKKTTLGSQIEKLRKKNGLSQEALAEEAGVNLRTIQRIENNESVPRGDTLKRITAALNVTPDEVMDYDLVEDKGFLKILNISALAFLFFPLLGILIPLIFWIMKRDKIKDVDYAGKRILNFQITWLIILFSSYGLFIITVLFRIKFLIAIINFLFTSALAPVFIIVGFYLINILYIFFNEILIFKGKQVFYKPAIRFFK